MSLNHEDYGRELSDDWQYIEVDGDHLIYENESSKRAIELMFFDGEWRFSLSEPNPRRGGMMDVVESESYGDLGDAFDKLDEYLER